MFPRTLLPVAGSHIADTDPGAGGALAVDVEATDTESAPSLTSRGDPPLVRLTGGFAASGVG